MADCNCGCGDNKDLVITPSGVADSSDQKEDLVITPGGPRPASKVLLVTQNEQGERQPDGSIRVVSKPHRMTPHLQGLLDSGDFVITPGGPRRKDLVHVIHPGETVNWQEIGPHKKVDLQGITTELPSSSGTREELPAMGSGWITYAWWTYTGAKPISFFTTTWVVPPAPSTSEGQLIYLFNGLQDSPVTHILQPVLQWGVSPDGGGAYWAVASWFVGSDGTALKTPLVRVNTGDTLTGVMTLTGQSGGKFSYKCEFAGLAGTALTVTNVNQLVMPVETLECYAIQNCADYPHTTATSMYRISLKDSSGGAIIPAFSPVDAVTDCKQHSRVFNLSSSDVQVDLYYTTRLTIPTPSVVGTLTRFRDHIDLFAIGNDGDVNATFWDASSGWNSPWFRLPDTSFFDDFTLPPQSTITSISRFQSHIDLFASGRDGAIYTTWWDGTNGWSNRWVGLRDSGFSDGFTVPPGSLVTSLSRYRDHIDLFVSGRDGAIYTTWWDGTNGWANRWPRLRDSAFSDGFTVPPGSPVSCLGRYKDHIDLFVTGRDGGVYSTFWDASSGWYNHWFRLGDKNFADNFTIPPGSPVTSLCRFKDHIDLFVSGKDGGIYSTFWDASSGWYGKWFRLTDSAFADKFTIPPGSPVTCLSRFKDHIDLFVAGRDGGVYSTFWDASSGWYGHWFRLTDTNFADKFTIPPGSTVSCISRFTDHIDLFVTGRDGAIYSTFWDNSSSWYNRWFQI